MEVSFTSTPKPHGLFDISAVQGRRDLAHSSVDKVFNEITIGLPRIFTLKLVLQRAELVG